MIDKLLYVRVINSLFLGAQSFQIFEYFIKAIMH